MSIAERITLIRKKQDPKMNQTEFAESLGMTRARYKNYELGAVIPDESTIRLICMTYNISRHWLETGEGNMEIELPEMDLAQEIAALMHGCDPMDIAIMTAYVSLPEEYKKIWREKLYEAYEKLTKKDRG